MITERVVLPTVLSSALTPSPPPKHHTEAHTQLNTFLSSPFPFSSPPFLPSPTPPLFFHPHLRPNTRRRTLYSPFPVAAFQIACTSYFVTRSGAIPARLTPATRQPSLCPLSYRSHPGHETQPPPPSPPPIHPSPPPTPHPHPFSSPRSAGSLAVPYD